MAKSTDSYNLKEINPRLSKQWHPTKNGNLVPKDVTPSPNRKVWWICDNNHEWLAKISSRTHGSGCPICTGQSVCEDNCLQTKNPELSKEWHPIQGSLILFLARLPKIFYGSINTIKRKLLFDAWSISNTNHKDECMKILFLGKNETDKNYFCNLIFNESFDETYLGKVWIWRIFLYIWGFRKNYDLIIVESIMRFCNLFKSRSNFVIPSWVSCEIDLGYDIGSQSMSKKTLKNNLRKINRGNFSYSITKDPDDFDFFYYKMHLPYISKRHGDAAIKKRYKDMKKSFENGELLQIKEGQKIVAGVIIDYKIMDSIPRITILGVLRGDFKYVKRGAIIALYYYTIQYLKQKKYEKFSLGLTRPFFSDGVLHYKLNWGAKIVCETSHAFLLSLSSKKKYLKNFLSCNPFILKDKNNLTLATFSDRNYKECPYLPKDKNKLKLYGLNKITSFSL